MQRSRPVLVERVWISAEVEEAQHGLALRDRVPARGTWDAVDRLVKRLRAPAIRCVDTCSGVDQLVGDACFVGRRSDVQRGVAGVHDVADLVEAIFLVAVSGGQPRYAGNRQ